MGDIVHTSFEKAFEEGRRFRRSGEDIFVSAVEVGKLSLPSGKLLACDPATLSTIESQSAFEAEVAPGTYPVLVSLARAQDDGQGGGRVCAAMVKFSQEPVARWRLATRPGERLEDLDGNDAFAHPVDTGISCFVDYEAAKKLGEEQCDEVYQQLLDEISADSAVDWASVQLPGSQSNLIAFTSGFGDGGYSSFWGLDANDKIVALATDFFVLMVNITSAALIPRVVSCKGRQIKHAELEDADLTCRVLDVNEAEITLQAIGENASSVEFEIVDITGAKLSEFSESYGSYIDQIVTLQLSRPLDDGCSLKVSFVKGIEPLE